MIRTSHPKALVSQLQASKHIITIQKDVKDEGNYTQANNWDVATTPGEGSGSKINFDPSEKNGGTDSTGSTKRPAFVGLAHELGHAQANDLGIANGVEGPAIPGTTPPGEVHAMAAENTVRQEHNLPTRPSYFPKKDPTE